MPWSAVPRKALSALHAHKSGCCYKNCVVDTPLLAPEVIARLQDLARDVAHPGEDVLRDLLHTYETDLRARLVTLRDALERGDHAYAAETAHALKGASLTIGAARMARLLRESEDGLRRGVAEPELLAHVTRVADETVLALREALTSPAPER